MVKLFGMSGQIQSAVEKCPLQESYWTGDVNTFLAMGAAHLWNVNHSVLTLAKVPQAVMGALALFSPDGLPSCHGPGDLVASHIPTLVGDMAGEARS